MVRCRCGVWTTFGLTCTKCALEDWTSTVDYSKSEEDEVETVPLDEVVKQEDPPEEDED